MVLPDEGQNAVVPEAAAVISLTDIMDPTFLDATILNATNKATKQSAPSSSSLVPQALVQRFVGFAWWFLCERSRGLVMKLCSVLGLGQ